MRKIYTLKIVIIKKKSPHPLKCGENATISLACNWVALAFASIAITDRFEGFIVTLVHSPTIKGLFRPVISAKIKYYVKLLIVQLLITILFIASNNRTCKLSIKLLYSEENTYFMYTIYT